MGARESLNRRENMAQKKSKERPYFSDRLDFPWVSEDELAADGANLYSACYRNRVIGNRVSG